MGGPDLACGFPFLRIPSERPARRPVSCYTPRVFSALFKSIFGTKNARELKKLEPLVAHINSLEPTMKALSEDDLRGKTAEFRRRIDRGESLDAILPEAFAVCREAGR